ncbi:MAG: hypothetical protein V1909_04605 [Candidatus Micrarchaeota archaeon]
MRRLWLLAALVFIINFAAAECNSNCQFEKNPTTTDLFVDRNIDSGDIEVTATLCTIDLAMKTTTPLSGEIIIFQACANGDFTLTGCPTDARPCGPAPQDYWRCSSGCCMNHVEKKTDADGKAVAMFSGKQNTTLVAVYLGNDHQFPSNSTGGYMHPLQSVLSV